MATETGSAAAGSATPASTTAGSAATAAFIDRISDPIKAGIDELKGTTDADADADADDSSDNTDAYNGPVLIDIVCGLNPPCTVKFTKCA